MPLRSSSAAWPQALLLGSVGLFAIASLLSAIAPSLSPFVKQLDQVVRV
jgi:hypothetical protein